MKNIILKYLVSLAVVSFFSHTTLHSQNILSPDQLQVDFTLFKQALKEAHPGLYRYNTREHFDSLFAITENKLSHEMTQQEFYKLLLPVMVQIGCGHTKLHPDNNWLDNFFYGSEKVFPLRLFFTGQKAYIVDSYKDDVKADKGFEVIAINDRPMPEIIDRLLSGLFSDGSNTTFKYIEMGKFFSAMYANLIESPDSFLITCRNENEQCEITLPAISGILVNQYDQKLAAMNSGKDLCSLEYLTGTTAKLTIPTFWKDGGAKYKKFLKRSFAEIKDKGIQNLVIDVRNNEGGTDKRGAMLLSYITDRNFIYYQRLQPATKKKYSFADNARMPKFYGLIRLLITETDSGTFLWKRNKYLKEQPPEKNSFKGSVFVLINGASFSVTSEFASVAHYLKLATFVGEETGGGYYGNNSGTFVIVTLPNSRLNMGIPMLAYYTAVKGYPWHGRGILPDYEIKPGIKDILSGKDTVLDFTMQLIDPQ